MADEETDFLCLVYDSSSDGYNSDVPGTRGIGGTMILSPQFPEEEPTVLWKPPTKFVVKNIKVGGATVTPINNMFPAPIGKTTIELEGLSSHDGYSDMFTYTMNYTPTFRGVVGEFSHFTAINEGNTFVKLFDGSTLVWSYPWRTNYPNRIIKEVIADNLGSVNVGFIDIVEKKVGLVRINTKTTSSFDEEGNETVTNTPELYLDLHFWPNFNPWVSHCDSDDWAAGDFHWEESVEGYVCNFLSTVSYQLREKTAFVDGLVFTKVAFLTARYPDFPYQIDRIIAFDTDTYQASVTVQGDGYTPLLISREISPSVTIRSEMDYSNSRDMFSNFRFAVAMYYEEVPGSGMWTAYPASKFILKDVQFYNPALEYPPNIDLFTFPDGSIGAVVVNLETTCINHIYLNGAIGCVCYPHNEVKVDSYGTVFLWDGDEWIQISGDQSGGIRLADTSFEGIVCEIVGTEILKSTPDPANTTFTGISPTSITGSGVKVSVPSANTSFEGVLGFIVSIIEAIPANTSFEGINAIPLSFVNSPPANTYFGVENLTVQIFISIYDKLSVKGIPANVDHGAIGISYAYSEDAIIIVEVGKSINGELSSTLFEGIPSQFYFIKGYVIKNGSPVQRTVRAYASTTGVLLGETESDILGAFRIGNLPFDGSTVFVVCQDIDVKPTILDHILPGL